VNVALPLAGWTKVSCIDYPGTVSTVLFFWGCNLRCPYCHNPQVVHAHRAVVDSGEVWAYLERRRGQVDGVVLSGGEPTCHSDLPAIAEAIRNLGYRLKLDTNGLRPQLIEECRPDYLALDVKTSPARYGAVLHAAFGDVRERLGRAVLKVREMGTDAEVRITVAPGMLDTQSVEEIADLVAGVHTVWLQPMQSKTPLLDPSYAGVPAVSAQELELLREKLASRVSVCRIRGR
jgi:pyruvate formate lyase activating enzyme